MKLAELLKPEYVKFGLNGKNKNEILQELAAFLASVHKGFDKKDAYNAMVEREKKGSTGIGGGLAIPHGRCSKVEGIHLAVVYDPEAKDFDAYDKSLAFLFFTALISDEFSPHEQLELWQLIVALCEMTDFKTAVKQVKTPLDLYNLIIDKEKELP